MIIGVNSNVLFVVIGQILYQKHKKNTAPIAALVWTEVNNMWSNLINEIKSWYIRTFITRNCWMPEGDVTFTWSDGGNPNDR